MKRFIGTIWGVLSSLIFPTTALAQFASPTATPSTQLPPAGISWPTVLVVTFAALLIFVGAIRFFKAFD